MMSTDYAVNGGQKSLPTLRLINPIQLSTNGIDELPFGLDCMDAGGRATHGAVAESLSKALLSSSLSYYALS